MLGHLFSPLLWIESSNCPSKSLHAIKLCTFLIAIRFKESDIVIQVIFVIDRQYETRSSLKDFFLVPLSIEATLYHYKIQLIVVRDAILYQNQAIVK